MCMNHNTLCYRSWKQRHTRFAARQALCTNKDFRRADRSAWLPACSCRFAGMEDTSRKVLTSWWEMPVLLLVLATANPPVLPPLSLESSRPTGRTALAPWPAITPGS